MNGGPSRGPLYIENFPKKLLSTAYNMDIRQNSFERATIDRRPVVDL